MVKTTNLRLGNWIRYKHYEGQVTAITSDYVEAISPKVMLYVDEFSGVPLTEEWLQKFGFDEYLNDGRYAMWPVSTVNKIEDLIAVFINSKDQTSIEAKNIEYVHQLQNLYFALTGEELEVKTPIS